MDLNNNFKCRMGGEDLANVQLNPKLWNLRPIIRGTTDIVKIPSWPETYAYVRENQDAWLAGLSQLPNRCAKQMYPHIRRMLLGVNSPILAPRIGAAQDVEEKMIKWSEGMEPRFISWNAAALHAFDFTFPDFWSRKKIKAIPSRKPEYSEGHWNDVYTPADDMSRLKWLRRETMVMMEVSKETRGGIYPTIEEVKPHGEEPVEIVMNDQVFYHAGDLAIPARPDAGVDMRQGHSGPGPRPDKGGDTNKDNYGEDDPMEEKSDRMSEFNLGALERDLLKYDFNETDGGGANETLMLITPSSFLSPTKDSPASLSPVEFMSLVEAYQRKGESKLLSESPRRRRIDESMRVAFLGTSPEEE